MKEAKTTGLLVIDYIKEKVWIWLYRNYRLIIESKYDNKVRILQNAPLKCSLLILKYIIKALISILRTIRMQ